MKIPGTNYTRRTLGNPVLDKGRNILLFIFRERNKAYRFCFEVLFQSVRFFSLYKILVIGSGGFTPQKFYFFVIDFFKGLHRQGLFLRIYIKLPFGLNKKAVAKWHIDNEDCFGTERWRKETAPHWELDVVGIDFDYVDSQRPSSQAGARAGHV